MGKMGKKWLSKNAIYGKRLFSKEQKGWEVMPQSRRRL
jgi:hypothetical protein